MLGHTVPQDMFHAIEQQRLACEAVIASKDRLIAGVTEGTKQYKAFLALVHTACLIAQSGWSFTLGLLMLCVPWCCRHSHRTQVQG